MSSSQQRTTTRTDYNNNRLQQRLIDSHACRYPRGGPDAISFPLTIPCPFDCREFTSM
jgi:hypothetical protein